VGSARLSAGDLGEDILANTVFPITGVEEGCGTGLLLQLERAEGHMALEPNARSAIDGSTPTNQIARESRLSAPWI